MKNLFKPVLFLFFAASITSCSNSDDVVEEQIVEGKRPFVDFELVPTDDPFTFDIINKAENYKTLEWRFGDDSLGTDTTSRHTFMATGNYDVTLTAISESGSTAKKLVPVKLVPDSIVKITAPKTGTNQVKFNLVSKAKIGSLLWTLDSETESTDAAPVMTYEPGTLNPFTLKLTTDKGSVVEVSKFATTEGVVTDVTNLVSLSVSGDNSGGANANEGSLKIIDNNLGTKLYMGWPGSFWAQFAFPAAQTIKFYGIGTANDYGTRLAKDWTLQGSNDGINWEVIDTRTGISPGEVYGKMFYYAVANPKPYVFYKWNVTANNGDGGWQLSEFRLFR